MRYALLVLLSVFAFAEDAKPQPAEAQRALAEYEKSVIEAHKVYDAANAKAASATLSALEKAKVAYMQKGDLEGANQIAASIKKLNDGETLAAIEGNIKSNLAGKPILEQVILGKWKRSINDTVYIFNADKTFFSPSAKTIKPVTWCIENGNVVVVWDTPQRGRESISYDEKTDMLKCDRGWTATRIKP
jgi:hypothetical protein